MFSRTLIPLDGRDVSTVALSPALNLALATGASIRLLTVLAEDAHEDDRRAVEAHLGHLAAGLAARGAVVDTRLVTGVPAEQIVAAVDETGADLIAMATHGRSGLSRAFLGSVAERVIAHSRVPVLLVPPSAREAGKVTSLLVPIDGAPGGALALASAIALAKRVGARIVLLQVVVPLMSYQMGGTWADGSAYFDPAWDDEALDAARRYVAGLAARIRKTNLEVDGRAEMGDLLSPITSVVEKVSAVAEETAADLIVMSTHAHTGPARALLGSVADAVVRTAHRPVLLVRRNGIDETTTVNAPELQSTRA